MVSTHSNARLEHKFATYDSRGAAWISRIPVACQVVHRVSIRVPEAITTSTNE